MEGSDSKFFETLWLIILIYLLVLSWDLCFISMDFNFFFNYLFSRSRAFALYIKIRLPQTTDGIFEFLILTNFLTPKFGLLIHPYTAWAVVPVWCAYVSKLLLFGQSFQDFHNLLYWYHYTSEKTYSLVVLWLISCNLFIRENAKYSSD